MLSHRRAGVLLHPTSFPSSTFSDAAQWLAFMKSCGLSVWQMLPMTLPDHTGSPYQSCSAMAINPALISEPEKTIDSYELDMYLLNNSYWLNDFSVFTVLKRYFNDLPWYEWPDEYKYRDDNTLEQFSTNHASSIDLVVKKQFLLDQEWSEIRKRASDMDIQLFGDMPIFVAWDSVDVWSNQEEFLLDQNGYPTEVAGVPPDYFSETGQRWGNPHYDWGAMLKTDFRWWRQRVRRQLDWFDMVRLDHFRGLSAVWMIDVECETAIEGYWKDVPGEALLNALKADYPALPIIAEDLGVITQDVIDLKQAFSLPGMSVLQFAFDHFDDNPHKPKNMMPNTVAYSGTHDNNTLCGWANSLSKEDKTFALNELNTNDSDLCKAVMNALWLSNANLAVAPLQDILGLGQLARMNTPGTTENNWQWRFQWADLETMDVPALSDQLKEAKRYVG